MGLFGNTYASRPAGGAALAAGDAIFEHYRDTAAGGSGSITLGTDTALIGDVAWAYPVTEDTTLTAADPVSVVLGRDGTFDYYGANVVHNVYMIGGLGNNKSRIFRFGHDVNEPQPANGLVWEFTRHTLTGVSVLAVTHASSLNLIKRAIYAIPIQITAAAPGYVGVSEITTIDSTLRASANDLVIGVLWGGFADPAAFTDGAYVHGDRPYLMPSAVGGKRKPGDLIGEVISKTLASASPSTVTITAASDCEMIRHIEWVIPVTTGTTARSVAWDGVRGASCVITGQNTQTDVLSCLVLGR
jgi:hypothetical protein